MSSRESEISKNRAVGRPLPIQVNALELASQYEAWMDEPSFNSDLVDAYRTGRLIHRYEWLLAYIACNGIFTDASKEFFNYAVRAAKLPNVRNEFG
jgi:hypothetical protein